MPRLNVKILSDSKYNFIKFHLNIWLTLDTYPFPSGQHQEPCYFFSKYRNFSVWKRNLCTLRSLIHAGLCVRPWWGCTLKTNGISPLCTFPQFSFIWFVTFSFKLELWILKCGLLKNTISIFKNSELQSFFGNIITCLLQLLKRKMIINLYFSWEDHQNMQNLKLLKV